MVQVFAKYAQVKDRHTGEVIEPRGPTWADTASNAFYAASRTAAVGIVKGANLASVGIRKAGDMFKSRTKAADADTPVSSSTKAHVKRAKATATAAATVTNGLVKSVAAIATSLGQGLAKSAGDTERGAAVKRAIATKNGQNVRQVAAAGLVAFSTVWEALEQSARIVGTSTADTASDVVQHKYGEEAAAVAADGMKAVGQSALAMYNVSHLGVKAVVRKTATSAAKHTLQLEDSSRRQGATLQDTASTAAATLTLLHAANEADRPLATADTRRR